MNSRIDGSVRYRAFRSEEGPLPGTLIVGPMKAGTTWIDGYLRARGDVVLPAPDKETFFFDRRFDRGVGWYRRRFAHAVGGTASNIVEVAPSYFHSDEALERIGTVLPRVRIVFTLRDPVARAISHFNHLRRYGRAGNDIRRAAIAEPELLEASRYATRVPLWYSRFGSFCQGWLPLELLGEDSVEYVGRLDALLGLQRRPMPDMDQIARYETVAPGPRWLASTGRRGAGLLRRLRLDGLVRIARRAGLHSLFFSGSGRGRPLPPPDSARRFLEQELREDIEWYARARRDAESGRIDGLTMDASRSKTRA